MIEIPYGRQSIDSSDIAAVIEALGSDYITQGPAVVRFEDSVAGFTGARHAVAVSSATAALHLGALALGLKPGSRLWTVPNTFVASANCGLYCGAEVDFVDINPRTYNISIDHLSEKLEIASRSNKLPDVLVPVHFAGQPCEMSEVAALCVKYGIRIMEDASHAIGSEYKNTKIGACAYSDLTVFSFHPVKIVTTGEGGMLLTNDTAIYEKLLRLRSHGVTRDPRLMKKEPDGPWYYEQVELGFNYRMTDIQAALGASQINRLPDFLARRRELAARYEENLSSLPIVTPFQHRDTLSAWHLYVILMDQERSGVTRDSLFQGLRERSIFPQVHYIPVHTQPWYQELGFREGNFPASETYYRKALSLPMYYSLSNSHQDRVIEAINEILESKPRE